VSNQKHIKLKKFGATRNMVLYVVYRAPKESTGRSALPQRLKKLGCQQLHRAFWKVDEEKARKVLKVLENNKPIFLRRLREIRNPQLANKKEFTGLGSLVIVLFSVPQGANREKVKNFLRRAPCIRLRRSVYAFSQKHKFYDKEGKLVDALKFVNFLREMRGEVKILSRVVIVNKSSVERLLEETKERIEKGVIEIVKSCKELYGKALKENPTVSNDRFSRIKRRYVVLKKIGAFYEGWLKLDFSRNLMRAYHALRKVNSVIKRD
jgi:hypothetical protein